MVSVVDVLKNVKVDRMESREIKIIAISIVQDQEEDSQKLVDRRTNSACWAEGGGEKKKESKITSRFLI